MVVDDVAVEKFAADIQNVCEFPRVTLQEVFVAPLRIPHGDAQSAPIDKALKPRVGRVDAAVKGLDGVEKSAADDFDVGGIKRDIDVLNIVGRQFFYVMPDKLS